MAIIRRSLSKKINGNGKSEILLRVNSGRGTQIRLKSGIFISPERFKNGDIVKPRFNQSEVNELRDLENRLYSIEKYLIDVCLNTPQCELGKQYLEESLDKFLHPKTEKPTDLREAYEAFLKVRELSYNRRKCYKVTQGTIERYEEIRRKKTSAYRVTLDNFTSADLKEFEDFLRREPDFAKRHPDIYGGRKTSVKGTNTLVCMLKHLRAVWNWAIAEGLTTNNPFIRFKMPTASYGTPYYITTEERDKIADFDLSSRPALEVQRDIFVFHCLIGCRVSDLIKLKGDNVINGAVEYVAGKTKKERPDVIRVPLHERAAALIKKYGRGKEEPLFPFITPQRYNDAIKEIFTICGITRRVTILNPTTGEEERRPLNEIASSHLARRTFVGNLYKRVKDPNLVGSLSGHAEGSRAFARYRDIDEEMKRELIELL